MRNESPVTNWEPPMSEKGLDESYAAIREALEKNNRGNVVNSLQNCVLALTHDPLLGGHIRRNLFNERLTIDSPLPWVRESSVISDTDLAFLQLHLERHYGLKAERCLPGARKSPPRTTPSTPCGTACAPCAGTVFPGCGTPCTISSARR